MSTQESQWSQKIRKKALELFPSAVVFKLSSPYVATLPDSVYVYQGMTTWVEVKREYNNPTEMQHKIMRDLYEQNGGRSYFVRILDKKKPYQYQVRSGHNWEIIILHTGTFDHVVRTIVQWKD